MKEGFCVVKFLDSSKIVKIASFDLIRFKSSREPFKVASCKDLPVEPVQVKWQRSFCQGSFSDDGYFDAQVLIIASSLKTAMAKAKESGIRLPPAPMISMPARSQLEMSTKRKNQDKLTETGPKDSKKRKANKAAKDVVTRNRLLDINESISSNPLFSKTGEEEANIVDTLHLKENIKKNLLPNFEEKITGNETAAMVIKVMTGDKELPKEVKGPNCRMDSVDVNKKDIQTRLEKREIFYHEGDKKKITSQKQLSSEDDDYEDEVTLPASVQSMKSASSSSETESKSSSEDESEDETAKLAEENNALKKELALVRNELSETERQLQLANNLRIKHKEKVEELEGHVMKLEKRNAMLQDMCVESQEINSKKVLGHFSPLGSSTPNIPAFKDSREEKSYVESTGADKSCSSFSKPSTDTEGSEKKKKKKQDGMRLDNEVIKNTCDRLLKHMDGTSVIKADEKGLINIGENVKVQQSLFDKNFKDNKLDIKKAARNLTAMTWTSQERAARSLTGKVSNKHPGVSPKKIATPFKVNVVLGAMKAHMLHCGDQEGPSLMNALSVCERAVGCKFASDAQSKVLSQSKNKGYGYCKYLKSC